MRLDGQNLAFHLTKRLVSRYKGGELKVILVNLGAESFAIHRGDRVAQLVLAPVVRARWDEVAELDDTARGQGGFGSTGGLMGLKG